MNRRSYLVAAIALVALAVGAVVVARRTPPEDLGGGTSKGSGESAPVIHPVAWLNTPGLTSADLRGKVVMYDFWTYSCINCRRTLPHTEAWYRRYEGDGLVIIGVHSPEFDFEKDHRNVAAAVRRLGVRYPVALDDDHQIWDQFSNLYWPAHYLYDRSGKQVSRHIGEGDYRETEDEIRELLGVAANSPRAKVVESGDAPTVIGQTPETYNGAERGAPGFASSPELSVGVHDFVAASKLEAGEHALDGRWKVADQYVQSATAGASLSIRFEAGQVDLVMASADGKPIKVSIELDGAAIDPVTVTASDLYALADHVAGGAHTLHLTPQRPGLRAFAFTFGS